MSPKPSAYHEKPYCAWTLNPRPHSQAVVAISRSLTNDFNPRGPWWGTLGLMNPKPSARMNPKPSAHHEKPYSAWALRVFVPCIRIFLLLVFVSRIRIPIAIGGCPMGVWLKGVWLKGVWLQGVWLKGVWLQGVWLKGVWLKGVWL
jgi:hypothetical protein